LCKQTAYTVAHPGKVHGRKDLLRQMQKKDRKPQLERSHDQEQPPNAERYLRELWNWREQVPTKQEVI